MQEKSRNAGDRARCDAASTIRHHGGTEIRALCSTWDSRLEAATMASSGDRSTPSKSSRILVLLTLSRQTILVAQDNDFYLLSSDIDSVKDRMKYRDHLDRKESGSSAIYITQIHSSRPTT